MTKQFPEVNCSHGAPVGRWTSTQDTRQVGPCRLFRVRINSQGYDDGGAYWGIGAPLYCATDDENFRQFARAADRESAGRYFEKKFPSSIIWLRKP